MANNELLDKVLKHIEHNQELWDQSCWASINVNGWSGEELKKFLLDDPQHPICGSARCFAGHACAFEGWMPYFEVSEFTSPGALGGGYTAQRCKNKAGQDDYISQKAQALLEIDYETADALFSPGNELSDLQKMVEHIKEHGTLEAQTCPDCDGDGEVESQCECCGQSTQDDCVTCSGTGEVDGY